MEATVLSVGKSVLSGALGYAKSAFAEELALQLGIQRDHAFIRDEMEMMQSFLMVAHDDRDDNKVVKTWVKQVRDVAYDVEDCLQDFAVRLGKPSWWRFPSTVQERRRIAKKMKELRAKVEDVSQRNTRYQLIKSFGSKATSNDESNTARAVMSSMFEVRWQHEKAKEDLVRLVYKKDEDRRVIAVWSTSGDLGKASIIERAYDDLKRTKKFECCAWIKLAIPFKPIELIQIIIRQFYIGSLEEAGKATPGYQVLRRMEMMKEDDLAKAFNEYMNDKSYLIVLSDLSAIKEWEEMKTYFPENKKGSRIIVSTRQVEVASLCVGTENVAPEHTKLLVDQSLYAFHYKGPNDGTGSTDSCSSFNAGTGCSDNSVQANNLTRADTIAASNVSELVTGQVDENVEITELTENGIQKRNGNTPSMEKESEDATCSVEPCSSLATEGRSLTRIETLASAFKQSELIGRVYEKTKIIELILKESQRLEIISVWGMGGLGKTTLVQDIYRSEKVNGMFEKHACVTIMRPFSPKDLLTSLKKQLEVTKTSAEKENKNSSEKKESTLTELLGGKKYLIVLDDVLFTTEWDHIVHEFPLVPNGSRIIVTTRYESVAKYCSGNKENIYMLNDMEDKDAKELFTERVFKESGNLEQYPELAEPAKLIMKKCNGLPLAIVTIGGFLANQPRTASVWRNLNEHISAEFEMNPELGPIRTILNKSYDGLPYHLKSCFLYLSIFPEDHKISRKRLVRRWTAEGYSREICDMSVEEIAGNYFSELLDRSMILPTQKSSYNMKSEEFCQVHDLMRDIAISKSKEENLVLRLDGGHMSQNQGIVRHLTIAGNCWKGDQDEFENIIDMSRIRSLTVFGIWRPFFISDKMRLLRVLDLEDTEGLRYHHLKLIGKLMHLRYLSLRNCEYICYVPDSFGNLRQLETLDIRGTGICWLPTTIINLQKLKYLQAGGTRLFAGPPLDLYDLTRMEWHLPDLMDNRLCVLTVIIPAMVCVRCSAAAVLDRDEGNSCDVCTWFCCAAIPATVNELDWYGVRAPKGMRRLKGLHSLGEVDIAHGRAIIHDIKRLTQLRKLRVTGFNKKNSQEFCSALAALSRLESLSVRPGNGLEGSLDGDDNFSPSKDLKSLKMYIELAKLPKWIQRLENLVKLKLERTFLADHVSAIQVLGELPNLAILRLHLWSFMSGELVFTDRSFGSLVVLEYQDNRCSVKFKHGAPQKLELLLMTYAVEIAGLEFLPSIKEVQVGNRWKGEQLLDNLQAQVALHPNKPILKVLS